MITTEMLSKIPEGTMLKIISIPRNSAWYHKKDFLVGRTCKVSEFGHLKPASSDEDKEWWAARVSPEYGVYISNGTYEILQP